MATVANVAPTVVSGTTPLPATGGTPATGATLAGNFQTFLTLLTTQLQNQNPLDPLDTNQFTQQLVQFAQVEQQLKSNDQLASLVSLQKTAQSTEAIGFVGRTAIVEGATATLSNNSATWNLGVKKDSTVDVTIASASGQNVFTGSYAVTAGSNQAFVWDGKGTGGTQWPAGQYTMTATAKDASGNTVGVSTQVQGVISSVDLTQTPPLLSIGGKTYTVNDIKGIVG
ncbi:MAG: Flagellar basalbody rod modification protein FlgD [Tardiphaga sp.]|nr:Flagellar basalbody rod modification protein FlgD [Tardiphaga sp.]MDB5630920.1 Flagellar basalbody rod modification protein FlgD [Tardiphaga sp.]